MLKALICSIAALVAPLTAFAGERPVVEQLRQDLVGKSFSLRIKVAGSTCVQEPGLPFAETSLVDTEVGDYVRYYARANRLLSIRRCSNPAVFAPPDTLVGMYLDAGRIDNMHPENSTMEIRRVEAKPDRIEFLLSVTGQSGDQAYGKIKLMLDKGYESQSLEQLEMSLGRVIELPRIRDIEQNRNAYDAIENEISATEASLSTELTARQKVVNTTKLLTLYNQESGAVARLNRVAFTSVQVPDTSAKIEEARQSLSGFERQVGRENINAAQNQYTAAADKIKADCERLPMSVVKTRAEQNSQISAFNTARRDLRRFESTRREVLNLSQSVSESDEVYSAKCSSSLDILSQIFPKEEEGIRAAEAIAAEAELQRQKSIRAAEAITAEAERQRQEKEARLEQEQIRTQQLESVNESFRKLKKQRAVLDAKLLTALGGPDEYATYTMYRSLLEEMIQNRQQAQALGSRSSAQEAQALFAQLQKLEQ